VPTTCSWSWSSRDGDDSQDAGTIRADDDARLQIDFNHGGKLTLGAAGHAITVEGGVTLKKVGPGQIRFDGSADIDLSGTSQIAGKLTFKLSRTLALDLQGQVNPQTGEVQPGGSLTLRF
jgi:hypothetical protein